MTLIQCPKCQQKFELSQGLETQIKDSVLRETEEKNKLEVERKVREETQKSELEKKQLLDQLEEQKKKTYESQKMELEIRKKASLLEDEKKSWELEKQRQLDAEKKGIWLKAQDEKAQEFKLREKEHEEKIKSMQVQLDDMQRKLSQGSQQSQGEVLELDLEETLRNRFKTDLIESVEKGVKGADIKQTIKTELGNVCGKILWESKRTKQWSDEWIKKLKDDMRNEKADVAVIVSTTLPKEITSGLGNINGIWVCSYLLFIPLVELIRKNIFEVARERHNSQMSLQRREEKKEQLFEYVNSHEFKQQVEALVEVFMDMNTQIIKERVAYEKMWKAREAQAQKIFMTTAQVIGSIKGRVGRSFPQIKGLDLPGLESPNKTEVGNE
jgi:hypothetical protein